MTGLVERVVQLDARQRARFWAVLDRRERALLVRKVEEAAAGWQPAHAPGYIDDPVGFVVDELGESIWSKQRDVLESVRDEKRTAVPACHGPGKTHLAARAAAWWESVHPPGTALTVTTATRFRQVKTLLWPHIRRVVERHGLPGNVLTTEWKIGKELVAWGFSARHTDESAVQGIHAPYVLFIVDEAGGIGHTLGQAFESVLSGGHARILAIGNPATDEEGTWFEQVCKSPRWNVVRIAASDTPAFTGEDPGPCRACPPTMPEHPVTDHLVDRQWVEDVTAEFGEDSAFVQARVHAKFPRVVANQTIPYGWCEERTEKGDLVPEPAGRRVSLGVDVASDGGDELAVARLEGNTVRITHTSRGEVNAEPHDVAGFVLEAIREAEGMAAELAAQTGEEPLPVRVKIDSIGIGWGVSGILTAWGSEGRHGAEIVPVNVAEAAAGTDVDASGKVVDADELYVNQRAQMWWAGRRSVSPSDGWLRLEVDRQTLAQMSAPKYGHDSRGRIKIERKVDLAKRGRPSPDRAEAVLLAIWEPPSKVARLRR